MGVVADQAAAIAALIDGVADTGVVYDHQPNPAPPTWDKFVAAFTATIDGARVIRAWTVQYVGEDREERGVAIGATKLRRRLRWLIRAHYGWGSDTEPTFRDHVEAVARVLDTNLSLSGTARDHDPVRVTMPGNGSGVLLGDHLCHYAELSLVADEEDTLATT